MYSFWDVNVAMLEGSVTTLQMFVLTLLFALPLGLIKMCIRDRLYWRQ